MMFTKHALTIVCLCLLGVDSGRVKTTLDTLDTDTNPPWEVDLSQGDSEPAAAAGLHTGASSGAAGLQQLKAEVTTGASAGLQQFIDDNQLKSCSGDCKGMLIGNIVEGLEARGFVQDVKWNSPNLIVTLNVDHAYGQISTPSKVPIAWVVDRHFTASVVAEEATTSIIITGLHTEVAAQGIEIYKQVMEAHIETRSWGAKVTFDGPGLAAASDYENICGGGGNKDAQRKAAQCNVYLEAERKAAAKWLEKNSKEFIKGSKKISKIVKTGIGNSLISWDNWGSILFSMISSAGKNVDELIFDNAKAGVTARASLWEGSQSYSDIMKYSLLPKAQTIGGKALTNTPRMLASTVASAAKSGWGFGMLFAHGDPAVQSKVANYPKAEPVKLTNLFSLCEKGEVDADPECGGSDHGRIHWTDSLPEDYL